jgi:tellurite resistance protein TerC
MVWSAKPYRMLDAPLLVTWTVWATFHLVVVIVLALDLAVLSGPVRRKKKALLANLLWVALAIGFGLYIGFTWGGRAALQFFTSYLVEYSLSLDNVFVFLLLLTAFQITPDHQQRILLWGVLTAIPLRAG